MSISVKTTAIKEQHLLESFITDSDGNQHTITAHLVVKYETLQYTVLLKPIPQHVIESVDFSSGFHDLIDRATEMGRRLIDEFAARNSSGQLSLFDSFYGNEQLEAVLVNRNTSETYN